LGPRAALDDTLVHVFNDSGYRNAWGRLLPADKAVLRALAQGVSDLHSLPARKRLGEELGHEGDSHLQSSSRQTLRYLTVSSVAAPVDWRTCRNKLFSKR
jgi:hypothetical protein